jgi:hypothetical protein
MPAVLRLPSASGRITPHNHPGRVPSGPGSAPQSAVPKLCQNPIHLECRELLFEREQLPQVVDIRHIRIESMERLEPANILRNQQVAGSDPRGRIYLEFNLVRDGWPFGCVLLRWTELLE